MASATWTVSRSWSWGRREGQIQSARQFAGSRYLPVGDVAHVGLAEEGQEMMLTHGEEGHVSKNHHRLVVVLLFEDGINGGAGIQTDSRETARSTCRQPALACLSGLLYWDLRLWPSGWMRRPTVHPAPQPSTFPRLGTRSISAASTSLILAPASMMWARVDRWANSGPRDPPQLLYTLLAAWLDPPARGISSRGPSRPGCVYQGGNGVYRVEPRSSLSVGGPVFDSHQVVDPTHHL